jgi:hypothetical protein
MLSTDWAKVQYYYKKTDSTGKLLDTILTNCGNTRTDQPTWSACTLKVGKLSTTTLASLPSGTSQLQFTGGWVNGVGLAGVKDYTYTYVFT